MNTTRIITTTVMVTLAAGLLGCSWGDTQFEWPWRRQSTPVTHASWTSPKDWPAPTTKPAEDYYKASPKDPTIATTQPTAPIAPVQDEPLKIGETREITTSVLPIKDKFITVQEILHTARGKLSAVECDNLSEFEKRISTILYETIGNRISNELIFSEADSRLDKAHKEHVNTQVEKTLSSKIANAGGSKTKFEADLLAEEGMTIKEWREKQRRITTVRLYEEVKFLPAISITRPMLLGYYAKHKNDAEFRVEKKVAMQLIGVLFERFLPEGVGHNPTPQELAKARAAAKEHIDKADKLLKDGADFTGVAKEFSHVMPENGGKLPLWSEGGFLQKEVSKAAFALKLGHRSGIVETPLRKNNEGKISYGGFYIVKAYEIQEGTTTSFEDAQETIEAELRREQFSVLVTKFNKRLRESIIPESPEFLKTAVSEAYRLYWKPTTNP